MVIRDHKFSFARTSCVVSTFAECFIQAEVVEIHSLNGKCDRFKAFCSYNIFALLKSIISNQLRRSAFPFFHSHSDATVVFHPCF